MQSSIISTGMIKNVVYKTDRLLPTIRQIRIHIRVIKPGLNYVFNSPCYQLQLQHP